jgi:hypothetical protein
MRVSRWEWQGDKRKEEVSPVLAVNAVSGKSVLSGTTSLSPRSNTMGRLTSVRMQNVISRLRSRCPTSAAAIAEGRNWRALRGLTEKGYRMGEEKSPKWACTCEGWNRPRAIPSAQANLRPLLQISIHCNGGGPRGFIRGELHPSNDFHLILYAEKKVTTFSLGSRAVICSRSGRG